MPKVSVNLSKFNGGLLTPKAENRHDLDIMPGHCRQMFNTMADVYGNAFWRGGMAYINRTKDNGEVFLIPFQVSETISYILEFGNSYIRFYRNRQLITTTNEAGEVVPYELTSPYTIDDLKDNNGRLQLYYTQSADVLYLCHSKYPVTILKRFADNNWVLETFELKGGPWLDINTEQDKIISADGVEDIVTLTMTQGSNKITTEIIPAFPYNVNWNNVGNVEIIINIDGADVASERWSKSVYDAQFNTPAGGYLMGATAHVINAQLYQNTTATYNVESRVVYVSTKNTAWADKTLIVRTNLYMTTSTNLYAIRSSSFNSGSAEEGDFFTPDMVGRLIRLFSDIAVSPWITQENVTPGIYRKSDRNYYKAITSGATGTIKPVHTQGIESDGGVLWEYLHSGYGWGKIIEYISPYEVRILVKSQLPANNPTYRWQFGLIGAGGIYPSHITFFRDRLALGINALAGPHLCFSQTSDYNNFADYINGEILPESAITLPILIGDLNAIEWLSAEDMLFIGTQGGILAAEEITRGQVFAPDNSYIRSVSDTGSCSVSPIIRNGIIYLDKRGKSIQELNYHYENESYEPDDLSVLASNLLERKIKRWAFQYDPDRIIWQTRFDGALIGFTYNKKQVVRAFHLHGTKGKVKDCTVISNAYGSDELYLVVKRSINGQEVRFIEVMDAALPADVPFDLDDKEANAYLIKNAFLVDCGIKKTFAEPTNIIDGLDHLEGEEVEILADGNVHKNLVVTGGQVKLDYPATIVSAGLHYDAVFEPLPPDYGSARGTSQGKTQRINELTLRLFKTAHLLYGESEDNMYELFSRTSSDKTDLPVPLKNGDYTISAWGGNTEPKFEENGPINSAGARMIFKKNLPLPACFVGIMIEVTTND